MCVQLKLQKGSEISILQMYKMLVHFDIIRANDSFKKFFEFTKNDLIVNIECY